MPFRRKKTTRIAPRNRLRKKRKEAFSRTVRRWVELSQRVRRSAREFLEKRRGRALAAAAAGDHAPPSPGTCYFVADLHLFANRSKGLRHFDEILRKASQAQHFVFGGDIFDFRWATMLTTKEAVEEAIRWLAELSRQCPQCQFHFLLGNHDDHHLFVERLAELEQAVPNLSWHRYYVRIGGSVFLHGDIAGRTMDAQMLADSRSRFGNRRKGGRVRDRLYDYAIRGRLHKPFPYLVYPRKIVAKRILAYLEDVQHGPANGVRNVYFGHTHRPLSDYQYGGLTFHNGGAPIKNRRFRILEADVSD
jgi:hypothetical protein